MHSKIAMSPFASMLPHLCENDNNFEIKLRIRAIHALKKDISILLSDIHTSVVFYD